MSMTQNDAVCQVRPDLLAIEELNTSHGMRHAIYDMQCVVKNAAGNGTSFSYENFKRLHSLVKSWNALPAKDGWRYPPQAGDTGIRDAAPYIESPQMMRETFPGDLNVFCGSGHTLEQEEAYRSGYMSVFDTILENFTPDTWGNIFFTLNTAGDDVYAAYMYLRGFRSDSPPDHFTCQMIQKVISEYASYWSSSEFREDQNENEFITDKKGDAPMITNTPYFNFDTCELVTPPQWDGERSGLGDIVLALLEEQKSTVQPV